MRLVFNFSVPLAISNGMDTSGVRQFVEGHNEIIKTISRAYGGFYRNNWSWTVIEMLDLCDKAFAGVEKERVGLKEWCSRFWHDNKAVLWMMRVYILGRSSLGKSDKAFLKCVMDSEFKKAGFAPFFEKGVMIDKYCISYADAIEFIDNMNLTIPSLPEIGAIHAGQECEYADWWDECDICFKRDRAIDKIKKDMIESSNNIFVNGKLYSEFMKAWIEVVKRGEVNVEFAEAIKSWSILPIIDTNYHASDEKYIITDRTELFKKIDSKIKTAFAAGKTPRQITEEWLSSVITSYFYFNLHIIYETVHDVRLADYELFFKVFYSIEAMDLLVDSQKECSKMIRDMF